MKFKELKIPTLETAVTFLFLASCCNSLKAAEPYRPYFGVSVDLGRLVITNLLGRSLNAGVFCQIDQKTRFSLDFSFMDRGSPKWNFVQAGLSVSRYFQTVDNSGFYVKSGFGFGRTFFEKNQDQAAAFNYFDPILLAGYHVSKKDRTPLNLDFGVGMIYLHQMNISAEKSQDFDSELKKVRLSEGFHPTAELVLSYPFSAGNKPQ